MEVVSGGSDARILVHRMAGDGRAGCRAWACSGALAGPHSGSVTGLSAARLGRRCYVASAAADCSVAVWARDDGGGAWVVAHRLAFAPRSLMECVALGVLPPAAPGAPPRLRDLVLACGGVDTSVHVFAVVEGAAGDAGSGDGDAGPLPQFVEVAARHGHADWVRPRSVPCRTSWRPRACARGSGPRPGVRGGPARGVGRGAGEAPAPRECLAGPARTAVARAGGRRRWRGAVGDARCAAERPRGLGHVGEGCGDAGEGGAQDAAHEQVHWATAPAPAPGSAQAPQRAVLITASMDKSMSVRAPGPGRGGGAVRDCVRVGSCGLPTALARGCGRRG